MTFVEFLEVFGIISGIAFVALLLASILLMGVVAFFRFCRETLVL